MTRAHPVTLLLLLANAAVAALLFMAGPDMDRLATLAGAMVPARLSLALAGSGSLLPALASLVTSQFLHGGLLHLGVNMLMLLAMGRLLEPVYGSGRLLILYLAGGVSAALAEWAVNPASPVPVLGASGAISALIGAQALLINQARAGMAANRLGLALKLGLAWAVVQWLAGVVMLGQGIDLAVAGHVGGFVAGLALAFPLLPGRSGSIDRDAGP